MTGMSDRVFKVYLKWVLLTITIIYEKYSVKRIVVRIGPKEENVVIRKTDILVRHIWDEILVYVDFVASSLLHQTLFAQCAQNQTIGRAQTNICCKHTDIYTVKFLIKPTNTICSNTLYLLIYTLFQLFLSYFVHLFRSKYIAVKSQIEMKSI